MLKRENYTSEHIDALRKQTGADPSILERTVFAFGLLEALCRVKMPFIFKGGTSLLILLDEPRRLSTDIDIIVAPGTDVDGFIQQTGQIFPFRDVKENIRKGNNGIEKRHFRFLFNSPRQGKEVRATRIFIDKLLYEGGELYGAIHRRRYSKHEESHCQDCC